MENRPDIDATVILDSLGDGVYVTDTGRKIIYWSAAAERITGWRSEDMVGRRCFENILAHVDKDGHLLCGEEHCPLHRSMVTGVGSEAPLVFARGKDGRRIPMHVTVAPIRDAAGRLVGGVEIFRDVSAVLLDLEKAKAIQSLSLEHDLPNDERIAFSTCYVPHDIVGGDYYGIKQLGPDQYGFLLADVMGHGVAAALYTIHLSSLWDRYHPLLTEPAHFAATLNNQLSRIARGDESFATGLCARVELDRPALVFAGAGGPPALLFRAGGTVEQLPCPGLPLGVIEDAPYDETRVELDRGDCLLVFSDGVVEIRGADDRLLGVDGLIRILKTLGYPTAGLQAKALEEALLKYSNAVRLDDDLTLIEMRLNN